MTHCTVYRVWSHPKGHKDRRLLLTSYHPETAKNFVDPKKSPGVARRYPFNVTDSNVEAIAAQPDQHQAALRAGKS